MGDVGPFSYGSWGPIESWPNSGYPWPSLRLAAGQSFAFGPTVPFPVRRQAWPVNSGCRFRGLAMIRSSSHSTPSGSRPQGQPFIVQHLSVWLTGAFIRTPVQARRFCLLVTDSARLATPVSGGDPSTPSWVPPPFNLFSSSSRRGWIPPQRGIDSYLVG